MLRCCFFSKRHLKESTNFGILGFDFPFFCQISKSFQHGKCKQRQTTKIARLRKLLGNHLCDTVLGSGIPICKQVNCNLEGKLYVPMDSIKRIREDLEFEVANSSSGRSTNSCEFGANSNSSEFVRIRTCIPSAGAPQPTTRLATLYQRRPILRALKDSICGWTPYQRAVFSPSGGDPGVRCSTSEALL